MINPYITGGYVTGSQFYGRKRLIETVLYGLDANLWIIGNRRVGKTSLLKEIEQRTVNSSRYIPLYWDMSASRTEAEFVEKLRDAVEDAGDYGQDTRWVNFSPPSVKTLKEALRCLADWVQLQNLQLLLLCDEAEGLLYLAEMSPTTLQVLRSILQNHPAIRPVLASTRRLSRLYELDNWNTSFFLDGFAAYPLLNFRDETAKRVIIQAQSDAPLMVEELLITQICQATGNHPLLLQKLCSQLFDIELGTLSPLAPDDLEPDLQVTGFFQIDFNALTPEEARLLLHIHLSPCTLTTLESQFPHLKLGLPLYNLTGLGFLQRLGDCYHIGNTFLAKWLETLPPQHTPQGGVTNRMLREINQERITSLQSQLIELYRHLSHLELRQAKQGLETPPHIITDIEDYRRKIARLETELTELGENITPFHSPQSE